jgi:hypothetical protein
MVFTYFRSLFFVGSTFYFFDSFYEFNTYAYSLLHAIVIVFTTIGFYKIFKAEALIFIEKSAFFWLNSAFLIYASGSIIVTIFSKYLIDRNPELQSFSGIICLVLLILFFTVYRLTHLL